MVNSNPKISNFTENSLTVISVRFLVSALVAVRVTFLITLLR